MQKTAYEMRISDWSSDVCSSDLELLLRPVACQATCAAGARAVQSVPGAVAAGQVPVPRGRVARRYLWPARTGRGSGIAPRTVIRRRTRLLRPAPHTARSSSDERRVGKDRVSTCRTRRSPYHKKKKKIQ